jgi:hypothetical protein
VLLEGVDVDQAFDGTVDGLGGAFGEAGDGLPRGVRFAVLVGVPLDRDVHGDVERFDFWMVGDPERDDGEGEAAARSDLAHRFGFPRP